MSIKLKQQIEKILGPVFLEKGFSFDKLNSRVSMAGFVYSKGDLRPSLEWNEEFQKGNISEIPKREEIIIGKSRWKPEISLHLVSFLKDPRIIDLGYLNGLNMQKWWPISNEEELNQSLKEIREMMDDIGWKWFVLP